LKKHVLIVSSDTHSLVNFRSSLINHFIKSGHKVTALTPKEKYNENLNYELKKLKNIGVEIHPYSLSRTGMNPFKDYFSYKSICKKITKLQPDFIMAYTAKPVIYTGIALRNFPKINFFPFITGVGYGFTDGAEVKRKIIRYLMIFLYKFGLRRAKTVIFQNKDDKKLFIKLNLIFKNSKTAIVNGSGVDNKLFPFSLPSKKPIFLMLSRLLIDKGVREYAEAAKIVKIKFPKAKFQLAGRLDKNPSCISSKELKDWINQGSIEYLKEISNVQKTISACRFYVLPSYREGTPRSVLEALSIGRPIITTDVPGCRETVINNENGLLVIPKNSNSLANAMIKLLMETDKKIEKMGRKSFILSNKKYAVQKVNKNISDIMGL